MYEVEFKVQADHEQVRAALEEIGASFQETIVQSDTYYNAPHRDFAETDEALRIRRETRGNAETTKLTYKGPLMDETSKTREEFETTVDEDETTAAILEHLGFTPAATVHKERDQYEYGAYHVTLDAVEGLGEFVEVETETEAGIERAREGAREVLGALSLDPADSIQTSYLGMILEGK